MEAGYFIVSRYGERYKIVHIKAEQRDASYRTGAKKVHGDDERFEQSVSRSKARVLELAACNPWEYFVTLTISPERYDRADLATFRSDLAQWIRNQSRLTGSSIKYLLVPEPHKQSDGWHMHGFVMGLPEKSLQRLTADMHLPYRLLNQIKKGDEIYRWGAYERKFGWCTLMPIRDRQRAASYVGKYVTKEVGLLSLTAGAHLFYASQGLKGKEQVFVGKGAYPPAEWGYENEWCHILWTDRPDWEVIDGLIYFDIV